MKQTPTTWDGQPVAANPPFGATVVVYRDGLQGPEFLVLHRAQRDWDGDDWEWTPPSGARLPNETILDCAQRELTEETGLRVAPVLLTGEAHEWVVFAAHVSREARVNLSPEHDRYAWVSGDEAIRRCLPETVSRQLKLVIDSLRTGSRP